MSKKPVELIQHVEPEYPSLFLDLEASGLNPDSYPIEIGICGNDGSTYERLIQPVSYWDHWSYDAQDIHGISREELIRDGSPAILVAQELNERFANKILWADSDYDKFWIEVLFEAVPFEPQFKVANLLKVIPERKWPAFRSLIHLPITHRAFQDAKDIRQAWLDYQDSQITQ